MEREAQSGMIDKEQTRTIQSQKAELDKQKDLLDIEKKQLEVEKERLLLQKEYLETETLRIQFAIENANRMIDTLRPGADTKTREMLVQTLLPNLLQLGNSKGLELPPELIPLETPQQVTGQLFPVDQPYSASQQAQNTGQNSGGFPVDATRQELELSELDRVGFQIDGRGQLVPAYDDAGQPVPGSKAWELPVLQRRATGYLAMMFHCPPGYPNTAPSVRVQTPTGGGFQSMTPNTIHEWNAGRMLADVALEIADSIP